MPVNEEINENKYIRDLSPTSIQLDDYDLVIIEKADGSGSKVMQFADLVDSITNKVLQAGNALGDRTTVGSIQNSTMQLGVAIPASSNLNSYTTPGKYYSNGSTTTATITNKPSDVVTGFALTVETGAAENWIRQILWPNGDIMRYYERRKEGDTWRDWHVYYADNQALLGAITIPEYANLNSYRTMGEYVCTTNTIGATIDNNPTTLAFRLTVMRSLDTDTRYITQILRSYLTGTIYTRVSTDTGSTWSTWYKLAKQKDYTPTEGIHASFSGGYIQQIGRMVFIGGTITADEAVAQEEVMLSALPVSSVNGINFHARDNSTGDLIVLRITNNGTLIPETAIVRGHSIRFATVYPATTDV